MMKKLAEILQKGSIVRKKQRGITLIALVVTIIVLLILAGVSISMLTGQNGILNRASEAKKNTEAASDLEFLQTKAYEAVTNYYVKGQTGSENEYILEELGKVSGVETSVSQGTVKYNGKTYDISEIIGNTSEQKAIEKEEGLTQITAATATDAGDKAILSETDSDKNAKVRMIIVEETTNGGKVKAVIPSGFYYVTGKPSTGLVISDKFDDDDNNSKGGNQFVWVPCNGGKATYQKHTYAKANVNDLSGSTEDEGNGKWRTYYYRNYSDWQDNGGDSTSVTKYGGFYIARYEAGVASNADFYANSDGAKYEVNDKKNNSEYIPVSKKNNQSWNYISQESAKAVSAKMYDKAVVKSQLVDGYAWDTTVEWMSKSIDGIANDSTAKGNYANNTGKVINNALYAIHRLTIRNSDGAWIGWSPNTTYKKGNVTTSARAMTTEERNKYTFKNNTYDDSTYRYNIYTELATGSLEDANINNIYDMAGNMWEWTTETGKHDSKDTDATNYAVLRGGSFGSNGGVAPVSRRDGGIRVDACDVSFGFRVVLYIQ